MIVIAILAILVTIAYPSYQHYVLQSRRSDAEGDLLKLQLSQESYRIKHNTFASSLSDLGGVSNSYYNFAISNVTASTYTFTATATGSQTSDTGCTSLTLDHNDNKTPASCWNN
ncbi:type IV pilin protein [Gallaecimonas kandeliae]|uniref:type IV pilin protein n=1 Tax=Gallaecimonas kandeliae TaxID=3029055 RepID=UPI002648C46D|nr:type IV pilin protein [Gallaecimonas kandeliae]WKE64953.1 type IV pilin protein [Gallaecimonas kandeliae]